LVKVNEVGEMVIVDKHQFTSCLEIVATGGITDSPYKRAIISARDGAKAVLIAYNYV
jgi:alkyl hydroperoxide reductase subunit AhpF